MQHRNRLSQLNSMILATSLLVMFTVGCSFIPHGTSQNHSVCPEGTALPIARDYPEGKGKVCVADGIVPVSAKQESVPRARQYFSENDRDVPDVFVGLAISGGGSRAAVFGMAVLEQLQQLGILQHVSAISTTSGGGLAGAYYATKGAGIDWGDAKQRMGTNFLSKWLWKNALPWNVITTTFTHEDRSDLMADVFDATLFNKVKYGDLGDFAVGTRPIWLANATAAQQGMRFTFSEWQFGHWNSSLASVPVAQAVMASAAFPGVFNSVTINGYPSVQRGKNGKWTKPLVSYTHLIDGGPTDNLGVEALLQLAASHQRATTDRKVPAETQGRCLIIVADSYPSGVPSRKMWDPDPRTWYDHVVDLNIFNAFDALLVKQRTDLLGYIGIVEGHHTYNQPSPRFVEFDMRLEAGHTLPLGHIRRVGNFTRAEREERFQTGKAFRPIQVPEGYFRCAAWHINLSGIGGYLDGVKLYLDGGDKRAPEPLSDFSHPVVQHHKWLSNLVSQIDTSFKLTGPNNCSSEFLLESLYAAAFILVREDYDNQSKVCNWLTKVGRKVSNSCGTFPGNMTLAQIPLDNVESDAGRLPTGRAENEAVRCKVRNGPSLRP